MLYLFWLATEISVAIVLQTTSTNNTKFGSIIIVIFAVIFLFLTCYNSTYWIKCLALWPVNNNFLNTRKMINIISEALISCGHVYQFWIGRSDTDSSDSNSTCIMPIPVLILSFRTMSDVPHKLTALISFAKNREQIIEKNIGNNVVDYNIIHTLHISMVYTYI